MLKQLIDIMNKFDFFLFFGYIISKIFFTFCIIVLTNFGGKVRSDRRCGAGEFALDDGSPSECDGSSENPCCSKWGFCGPDADHCACEGCVDYRSKDQIGSIIFHKYSFHIHFL